MTTPLTLRARFRTETAEWPVWETVTKNGKIGGFSLTKEYKEELKQTFRGNPKTIYGQWLEEHFGSAHEMRTQYKRETGLTPVEEAWERIGNEKFSVGYSLWLEEKLITALNIQHKLRIT